MTLRSFLGKFAFLMLALAFAVPAQAQQPHRESLLNGMKVLMFPDATANKVWVRIRVNSGSAFDPAGKEGVMQMLAANFFPTDAAKEYFRDELGGGLEITANYDYIEVDASAKPENLTQMLETLGGGIANTVIDKDTTAKLRSDMLAKLKQLESDPNYVADRAAAKRLFGTFPYGRPVYGTEDSVKKIGPFDLEDAKNKFLTADNAAMTISGNFGPQRAMPAVKRYFGGWAKAGRHIPATFRQPEDPPAGLVMVASPVTGRFAVRFALRGTARSAGDMAAANVYARILEAKLKARLPAADSANVFARSDAFVLPGWVVVGFSGTTNDIGTGNG
ncbi:MAG: M16 family metallopeptidase, partial [Pyrinomonadaceae bacterium]